jgi:hypothetical protein
MRLGTGLEIVDPHRVARTPKRIAAIGRRDG